MNTDGTFTYSFDRADVDANGGNQTVSFQVAGSGETIDTDTVQVVINGFAKGTGIATATGECAVEALQIGDLVRAADGRDVAVKWVGRQTLYPASIGLRCEPVRIRAGALGPDRPNRDLVVTGDHGMVINDLVVNASALVNGRSIDWVPGAELAATLGDGFTVYHVETEDHDVILANGAPSETYCDVAGRAMFDNYAEYLGLYGVERLVREMPAPRIGAARLLPEPLRAQLGITAPEMMWDQPQSA